VGAVGGALVSGQQISQPPLLDVTDAPVRLLILDSNDCLRSPPALTARINLNHEANFVANGRGTRIVKFGDVEKHVPSDLRAVWSDKAELFFGIVKYYLARSFAHFVSCVGVVSEACAYIRHSASPMAGIMNAGFK
jgi:hypothetical protein